MEIDNLDRLARAFESIAHALDRLANIEDRRFRLQFPPRKEVQDATLTRLPTEEDRIKEAQGASAEPIEDWLELEEPGPRERQFISQENEGRTAEAVAQSGSNKKGD